jgi:hypothetical protein
VGRQKKVIILTDSSDSIQPIAESIGEFVGGLPGYQTAVIKAEEFTGVELLPTSAFFLGCESPKPSTFAYIEDMLGHINLAGRPCGIFSSSSDALKYLSTLVQDSEAATGKPFLATNSMAKGEELHDWVRCIVGDKT